MSGVDYRYPGVESDVLALAKGVLGLDRLS